MKLWKSKNNKVALRLSLSAFREKGADETKRISLTVSLLPSLEIDSWASLQAIETSEGIVEKYTRALVITFSFLIFNAELWFGNVKDLV